MFKNNVGSADRVIRAILGIVLVAVFFMQPDLAWKWVVLFVGLILLFTSVMSTCFIYTVLGKSTNKSTDA
ncbi:MAG: DUF2892 domain-containing protein [Rhodobacteraceae bacterium]|nr:DUF2892 domain-containing protein [Paracoccaceae bacterium]